ncbi:MAG: IS5/IS1182 family transposase, partial [Candidatus Poribacteria bacterium]|nr:IS5/IS1182 family transposase [Candidatus Poribacteria bacterium]
IDSETAPRFLRLIPTVEAMRQIWVQQYFIEDREVHWRDKGNLPASAMLISSPHDTDAHYAIKRNTTTWVGYKVHLTETCDKDSPNLITNVQTTPATDVDSAVVIRLFHLALI